MTTLSIIIVNWNSGDQLHHCVDSIRLAHANRSLSVEVFIVDNASTDNSLSKLADISDVPLSIIRNEYNRGFGAACNQGAERATGKYLLFLNPDTVLYSDSLSIPIDFMDTSQNENVGICGIQLVDERGHVSRTCARFPTLGQILVKTFGLDRFPGYFSGHYMLEWDHACIRQVDQVMGAFFLVRHSLFRELNGFDERFFVYYEEVDFSYRAKKLGWSSVYIAETKAFHAGGGTSRQVKARRLFYSLRSRILYGYKHFDRLSANLLLIQTVLLEPLTRVVLAISHLSIREVGQTVSAFGLLIRNLPLILRQSRASVCK